MKVDAMKLTLQAKDMDRAVGFYRDVMGLTVKQRSANWSELTQGTSGGAVLALHGGGDGAQHETGLSFEVSDIATACKEVVKAGGKVLSEPKKRAGEPIALAAVLDPEGNSFSMSQYVGM